MEPEAGAGRPEPDHGLKRLLTLTFIALVVTVLLAGLGAYLAVQWFDGP